MNAITRAGEGRKRDIGTPFPCRAAFGRVLAWRPSSRTSIRPWTTRSQRTRAPTAGRTGGIRADPDAYWWESVFGHPFPSKWGAAAGALFVCLVTAASASALPDISQAPAPASDGGITAAQVGDQVRLQFPSQIDIGASGGPLTITGSRQDTSVNTMDAFENGVSGVVGALQYNYDPTHQHWHYLALDRYDLRTHDPLLTEVARDQKTGFCLVQSDQIN